MHELSLAGGILRIAEDAVAREGAVRVRRLVVEAGALSAVDVRALRFALESIASGTCLEQAAVELREVPGQAWCLGCSRTVPIRSRLDDCPACGSARLQPTSGTELRVVEMYVEDLPSSEPAGAPAAPLAEE
ncbi:hydrogenase maturation nickel metallochaperone HypA [Caldimonas thermodepolymerans]|jgi:hydrogenase nickel incorporation protein HypA/HybF|uniref:Hydrogenase maturation factor HypA n=1 Tax=Caldimonas thermodepolymerans TaxID=215580 RepID=A0A2S5T524_9BURK|nr:hydrogenase maturation nickel metallochaperone HypA [Caldimonas thermodepolymerans]PPE70083.1 hydrogenase maturation nickel metallochaperone HypA [Caldimonas thermodepolymerans]QPC31829.1 hydrogenase maturation nickel metallochaperone HypA [Caldimonas thermodepolymerans]RDI01665.1 hydrogenase nickel incorporation protein HypA/HybF [Caldimonas thermodepolymerans]TCP05802.1 hydrogenase nickel incorporation protein HypA/HybF [Caldimonas thermodepolymerans]UZG44613.1 hydrogenase maturation nick